MIKEKIKQLKEEKHAIILAHYYVPDEVQEIADYVGDSFLAQGGMCVLNEADYTVLATGGIGGLYKHSTNYSHITGDTHAIAIKHGVALKDMGYVQIHPTTLYAKEGRFAYNSEERVDGTFPKYC